MSAERKKVTRASTRTTLKLGQVEAPIGLYKTNGKADDPREWDKATPDGEEYEVVTLTSGNFQEGSAAPMPAESAPADPFAGLAEDVVPEDDGNTSRDVLQGVRSGKRYELDEARRGVRLESGKFVDLTGRIEQAEELSRMEALQIVGFVRRERVPRERIVGSYYVGVEERSAGGVVALLYRAMRQTERAAVVRWTKRKGQTLGVMVPHPSGALVVLELVFSEYFRAPSKACLAASTTPVADSAVAKAATLIGDMGWSMSRLDEVRDGRAQREEELYARAISGDLESEQPAQVEDPDMVDLEALLAASVAGE